MMTLILILIILGLICLLLSQYKASKEDKKKIEHFYNMTNTLAEKNLKCEQKNLKYKTYLGKIKTLTLCKEVGSLAMAILTPQELKDRIMGEVKNYLIEHLMEQPGLIHITEERLECNTRYTIKIQFVDQSKK